MVCFLQGHRPSVLSLMALPVLTLNPSLNGPRLRHNLRLVTVRDDLERQYKLEPVDSPEKTIVAVSIIELGLIAQYVRAGSHTE